MSRSLLTCSILIMLVVLMAGCQAPAAPGTPTPAPTPIISASAEQSGIQAAWAKSKHANTFVTAADGSNNMCARCHSPEKWLPTDPADMPETCAMCKFTVKPKPLTKADWKSISCETCHRVENGVLSEKVAYNNYAITQFETGLEQYVAVASNKELCEKCHRDQGGFNYRIDMGSGKHSSFDCTQCHDPHSTAASCTASGCHADVMKPGTTIPRHDQTHSAVTCSACHDASGLKVGPTDGMKNWVTYRSIVRDGKKVEEPYVSHNVQRKVDCVRCHSANNPWGLSQK